MEISCSVSSRQEEYENFKERLIISEKAELEQFALVQ